MAGSVEDKVRQLEHCVDNLRAEIDMKMQIIEQILNTRNEQFVLHKKLIEEEHAVYENVLSHWRNRAKLGLGSSSGQGQSNVSPYFKNPLDYATTVTTQNSTPLLSFKRTSSSATFTSTGGAYSERLRHKAKRFRTLPTAEADTVEDDNYSDVDNSCVTEMIPQDIDPLDAEVDVDLNSGADSDDGEYETTENGMEKRVFVNFYSESGPPQSTDVESSSDPVWLHFLHEEKGSTALCKHCDEKGYQQMYKLKTPSMALLRRHLKKKHKITVDAPILPVPEVVDTLEPPRADGRRRLMPFLRHNDYLYTLKNRKNAVEYWKCREKMCTGRLVKRPGNIQPTIQHNCLTTAADCEAILFRTRIREMAEAEPTLPPSEVIAAAKIGLPEDVLEIVPNDDSLRGTIRRIRQALDSATPTSSGWT